MKHPSVIEGGIERNKSAKINGTLRFDWITKRRPAKRIPLTLYTDFLTQKKGSIMDGN